MRGASAPDRSVAATHGLLTRRLEALTGTTATLPVEAVSTAFDQALTDQRAWSRVATAEALFESLRANGADLIVLLYRLGRHLALRDPGDQNLASIHGLMRATGGCEVYFNTEIGEGFRIVHGLGTVIGSRHTIGRRFTIHHGCTLGHLNDGDPGCRIGDDVMLYPGATILGPVSVGDGVVLGAQALLLADAPAGAVMVGTPARPTSLG